MARDARGDEMNVVQQISESLQRGEDKKVAELTRQALDAGLTAGQILNDGLLAGMDVVSARFGANEIFLPEVLLSARAMNAGMDLIKPLLIAGEVRSLGKVVIGTIRGDLHDIHLVPPGIARHYRSVAPSPQPDRRPATARRRSTWGGDVPDRRRWRRARPRSGRVATRPG